MRVDQSAGAATRRATQGDGRPRLG